MPTRAQIQAQLRKRYRETLAYGEKIERARLGLEKRKRQIEQGYQRTREQKGKLRAALERIRVQRGTVDDRTEDQYFQLDNRDRKYFTDVHEAFHKYGIAGKQADRKLALTKKGNRYDLRSYIKNMIADLKQGNIDGRNNGIIGALVALNKFIRSVYGLRVGRSKRFMAYVVYQPMDRPPDPHKGEKEDRKAIGKIEDAQAELRGKVAKYKEQTAGDRDRVDENADSAHSQLTRRQAEIRQALVKLEKSRRDLDRAKEEAGQRREEIVRAMIQYRKQLAHVKALMKRFGVKT